MKLLAGTLIGATLLAACGGDGYSEVQRADTIEAYSTYLTEHPDGQYRLEAETRLEALLYEKATLDKTLEAFDAYLATFPEGRRRDAIFDAREVALFDWARRTHTSEAWASFLADYPKADRGRRSKAKSMIAAFAYAPNLEIGEVAIRQVNLAEDPAGPLDGWGFEVPVTNRGNDTLESAWLTIEYLDDQGRALEYRDWPIVAQDWPSPVEESAKKPMKPGETRTWLWTSGQLPPSWSKQARVYLSQVKTLQ